MTISSDVYIHLGSEESPDPKKNYITWDERCFETLSDQADCVREKLFQVPIRVKDHVYISGYEDNITLFLIVLHRLWKRFEDSIKVTLISKENISSKLDYAATTEMHTKEFRSSFLPLKQ